MRERGPGQRRMSDLRRAVGLVATGFNVYFPDCRRGQNAYNALYLLDQAAGDTLHSTEADPFYDDGRLPAFWAALDVYPIEGNA